MSNATAIVRVGGMGWLKPVVTVSCCLVCYVLCMEESPSQVFAITDRMDIMYISSPKD